MLRFFRGGRRTAIIWWLIILGTAVGFIVGFSVFPSIVRTGGVSGQTAIGAVNGQGVTQAEWERASVNLLQTYRAQTGRDPDPREEGLLREQAWLQLLTDRLLAQESKRLGLGASDAEVVFALRNTPPTWIRSQTDFLTNGQFDARKYISALNDPNYRWGPFEEEERRTLPSQKLEERILATSKFSEPELRRAFAEQNERAKVTVARWNPSFGPIDTTRFDEAAQRKYYDEHRGKFTGPDEANAVIVFLPKRTLKADEDATMERARSLVARARRGESFPQLAREQSEAPNAQAGGEVGRDLHIADLPPQIAPKVTAATDSAVFDPIHEGNRVFVLQVRRIAARPAPLFRARQIMLSIPMSETAQQEDRARLAKLRSEARSRGLGPAAAAMGIGAQETGWFRANLFVPQLLSLPQAQQWALQASKGALSPIYDLEAGWALLQVKDRRDEGPRAFDQVRPEVRMSLEREERMKPALAAAERARARMRSGAGFAEAAKAESASAVTATDFFKRTEAPPALSGSNRAVGLAFGLPIGEVAGPLSTPGGAMLLRKDAFEAASPAAYDTSKAKIARDLLTARQQRGLSAWLDWLRGKSKIEDRRGDASM